MPLQDLHFSDRQSWALWKIEEDEDTLLKDIGSIEQVPETITNTVKRLEHLAGRVLIKTLAEKHSIAFKGLIKDDFGKPYLKNSTWHISLSHSYPYIAAIISNNKIVGIDLEQPKEKLLKVASRVLSEAELIDAGKDIVKHCIYWCAKESLIKIYGKKDLTLNYNLQINPFIKDFNGNLIGNIIVDGKTTEVALQYIVRKDFVLVLNQ